MLNGNYEIAAFIYSAFFWISSANGCGLFYWDNTNPKNFEYILKMHNNKYILNIYTWL